MNILMAFVSRDSIRSGESEQEALKRHKGHELAPEPDHERG